MTARWCIEPGCRELSNESVLYCSAHDGSAERAAKHRAELATLDGLRVDLAKAQAWCAELTSACVALEGAIHSEPEMSGRLKNLHISPVRGAEPLRRLKLLLSRPEDTSALSAVRLAQRFIKDVAMRPDIYNDPLALALVDTNLKALAQAFGEGE